MRFFMVYLLSAPEIPVQLQQPLLSIPPYQGVFVFQSWLAGYVPLLPLAPS